MSLISTAVIWVVMLCAVAGAIAALFREEEGLGKEFLEGLRAIGTIFIPVAGIMASVPLLEAVVGWAVGPAFALIGADPAMAATTFIASDMGGYRLAGALAHSPSSATMALVTGLMAGATIVFSIPVGLALLRERDHRYLALGMMCGLLSIPLGVLISSLLLLAFGPATLAPSLPLIGANLVPLILIVGLLALGLSRFPDVMVRGFRHFGRGMDVLIKLVLVAVIVQFSTGAFTKLFGRWGLDPVLADYTQVKDKLEAALPICSKEEIPLVREDIERALEVAGTIGMMLAGAFPMVYLIRRYLARPMETFGRWVGLRAAGAAGLLAAMANIVAMFHLVKDMRGRDKVRVIAFAVCAAFVLGDHLAFTATKQPDLLPFVMLGKLGGGVCGFLIAHLLAAKLADEMDWQDEEADVRAKLAHVPLLRDRPLTVTRLEGGLTNDNYRIDADGEPYVLRVARPEAALLGIDRDREAACTEAAAGVGVAPEVITYLPEQITLIRRFVVGRALTALELRQPATLRQVAEALRQCHGHPAPAEAADFSPFATARSYLDRARQREVALPAPAELDDSLKLLEKLERQLQSVEPGCLCHNDLLPANFIDDGQRVWVIDWEYAGRGDRFFDLGNLAANGEFDEGQEKLLLEAYFGQVRPEDLRRLKLMRLASDFREAMWGYLQSAISSLREPRYYRDYGRRHLERFLIAGRQLV